MARPAPRLGRPALAGAALGSTTLKLGGHYLAMVTICFQVIYTLSPPTGSRSRAARTGSAISSDRLSLFPSTPRSDTPGSRWRPCCWSAGLVWWLRETTLGRSMRAIWENELAAEALGVDTRRVKVIAFTISAVIGALGGAIYASGYLYISPDSFNFDHAVAFLAMVLVGGTDSALGAILGATCSPSLPEWLRDLQRIYLVIYGCAIILVIVFMPEGLWGYVKLIGRRFARVVPLPPAPRPVQVGGRGAPGEEILRVEKLPSVSAACWPWTRWTWSSGRGEAHALIGPNGSGKTTSSTCFRACTSRPRGGSIFWAEASWGNAPAGSPARGWPARSRTCACSASFRCGKMSWSGRIGRGPRKRDPDARAGGHRVRGAVGQGP